MRNATIKKVGWGFFACGILYTTAIAVNILMSLVKLDLSIVDGELWLKGVVCFLAWDRLTQFFQT